MTKTLSVYIVLRSLQW